MSVAWIAVVSQSNFLEDPQYRGTLTVNTDTYTTSVDLGCTVETLAIVRTEPDLTDLAALENIKASVRGGVG